MADLAPVPAADPFPRQRVRLGREDDHELELAYYEVGFGHPIVFLHGNPTSSHLWRNVVPHVQQLGRCIAVDLIGMGESSRLPHPGPGSYSFGRHAQLLSHFLEQLEVTERVVLVGSEWGSALAFDWARRNPGAVRGIAFMEPVVQPVIWADVPEDTKRLYQQLRGPGGEQLSQQEDPVVEELLPASVLRGLAAETLDRYRQPYRDPADRWPTLEWTRQLPIDHAPPAVHDVLDAAGQWMAHSEVPKLFVDTSPAVPRSYRMRRVVRRWPALTEVTLPAGRLVAEDAPDELGRALADWIPTLA
ncbi:haloalkane dehalogenase [Modestobacter muralis]|uniref:Haloalkane dehalogenase n=1 Tax=Modestobacter muralis TaxID=1608614 RepID=A0A6P0EX65_9ACTN|nr:haloalkane dehalogenase [Modestobacter muralis]NEK96291.1 haloalkane dehalogenase [Modestobacter muralis]NEN53179.1 haloalkane dehalogenase [Modestobacter muralis]